ncbi:carboxylesterase type b protein [Botryosphaeria dothidea]|uniref:Carboxylic ester hydrolase n=1 Tax=Botryosphaeria dothidea TaxID=55169 RepID=A0A8H4ITW5_9PEZI|nr:carboxylesterase type b protein [Botryosphaeria dothidea]
MFSSQITLLVSHLLLILAPPALCQFPNPPAVLTPQGIYYPNTTLPDIDQFLGIPYAAPPIGPLRFAAPAPYTSGSPRNVVNATSYGPGCLQNPSLSHPNGLSEDCLTLNIFRPTTRTPTHPHKPPPLLPVLVFIYGGANIGSQARLFAAPNLAAHALRNTSTPILTCTLNYRTGALAFLPSRLFARARLLNAGLKDQRAALQWLHANIAAFGGDPRRVVIFGQSAGSFDAWMQARYAARDAPADRPFAGAILESGAPASLALKGLEPSAGDTYLQASLRAFGCPAAREGSAASDARVLACLRGVGAERLTQVWFQPDSPLFEALDEYVQLPVGFGVDGDWVGGPYYWDEKVAQIPMIVGDTLNEGSIYGLVPTGTATNETYLTQVVAKNLNTTNLALAAPVVSTYYNHTAAENGRGYNADPTAPDSYYIGEALLGDAVQHIPRRVLLGRHSSGADSPNYPRPQRTWGYRWTQRPPLSVFNESYYGFPPELPDAVKVRTGVLHAAELAYVFGDVYGFADATDGDRRVAALVQGMWISFAYWLDPNFHGSNPYNPSRASIFNFEDQGSTTPGMIPDNMRLDGYNAYKDAITKAGRPALPEIRASG